MSSPVYSHRVLYHVAMRLLYGRYFEARYAAVAEEIPRGSMVVDVCAGDCYLYLKHLRHKEVSYLGLDISPRLVRWARRHGASAQEFDLWKDEVPTAEIVVLQASLYQFVPHVEAIMHKLLYAARGKLVVSEPIHNLSASGGRLFGRVARYLTAPNSAGEGYVGERFDRQSLTALFGLFDTFQRAWIIPGGREMIGVFGGSRQDGGQT
jgi:hypothetical protein